ncbi:serine hydrolase domain-containing protein [Streptomyces sp. 2P-4]|uniref:serine hydrolase domain-containing protein n=1 Tax=Streptomyces sp. 2P-4 TaxID=2931974 RepID=UPI0025402DED|nr:serine hydrolase domain-containing protein [Streptomyces sp. 2P-4]
MSYRRVASLCVAALAAAALHVPAAVPAGAVPSAAGGCVATPASAGGPAAREIRGIVEQAKAELDLRAVQFSVAVDGQEVVTGAVGESRSGEPATPAMHFRAGSVGIVYLGIVLLQLAEEGRVRLDDPVSRWLPDLPDGDRITLKMLGTSTSGLHDYVTDPVFVKELSADPNRHWTPEELVGISIRHPLWYPPGTDWSYSHANFVLLGAALEKITGTRLDRLLQERVMGPAGLRQTRNGYTPAIPQPVLHAFTEDAEGLYVDSTYWNPSWTTAPGAVLTMDVCDLARSARAVGAGELLSPASYRLQRDPGTAGLGHATVNCPASVCLRQTREAHFGVGVIVLDGWVMTNPSFFGYAAVQAYLPEERLAIAVSTTTGPRAPQGNTAETVARRISAALAPDRPLTPFPR